VNQSRRIGRRTNGRRRKRAAATGGEHKQRYEKEGEQVHESMSSRGNQEQRSENEQE
jgi:hypothetical protein